MSNENNNPTIGLSRRNVLIGLGAVGVASAGAGLGTTAFFSDEESFTDNTITAGQFELHVSQTTTMVDQGGIGPDEISFNAIGSEDEPAELNDGFLNIVDAKPGDSYQYCWEICVKHNPGFVEITLGAEESSGNDNGVQHVDADGTLGEYMLAVATLVDQNGDDEVVFTGTLGELVEAFEEGGLVHAVGGENPTYCHLPCETDVEGAPVGEPVELCVDLYLPTSADVGGELEVAEEIFEIGEDDSPGNAVQGAQFVGSVDFAAEQCRHNDNPFEKYNVSTNAPQADPVEGDEDGNGDEGLTEGDGE